MAEAAGQKAVLTFVEILMNSSSSLTISQLAGHSNSRSFTSEMRTAFGGNEEGLKKLLLKYPSVFTVNGNLVSLYEHEDDVRSQSPFSDAAERASLPDVSVELQAVRYFQSKFARKGDRWMPIASLAGHLSQASREIRHVVGPQVMFQSWLLKHPHIFEISENSVGLREDVAAFVLNGDSRSKNDCNSKFDRHKQLQNGDIWRLFDLNGNNGTDESSFLSPVRHGNDHNEYAAIFYLAGLLIKHEILSVEAIYQLLSVSDPGQVQNTLNSVGVEKFLQDHKKIFAVENGTVRLNAHQEMNDENEDEFTRQGIGIVYHVAKLWGIIDLGDHEHVFFDRSILESDISDLQAEYKVGDELNFFAFPAPKKSRAKWKAVKVWKSNLRQNDDQASTVRADDTDHHLSLISTLLCDPIATCLNQLVEDDCVTAEAGRNNDELSSLSGSELDDGLLSLTVTDSDQGKIHQGKAEDKIQRRFASVACQTLSTGDIIATSFYQSV